MYGYGIIDLFGAKAGHVVHGMAMTGFHKYVHTIRETAKNMIYFKRLVQAMEGERENTRPQKKRNKEKSSTPKTRRKNAAPQAEKERKKKKKGSTPTEKKGRKERKGKRRRAENEKKILQPANSRKKV